MVTPSEYQVAGEDGLAVELLRRHVRRAADDRRAVRRDLEDPRGAEVGDLDQALLAHQHVARAQVAVNHVLPVRVVDSVGDLHDEVERAIQLDRAFTHDDRLERLARDVLHDDEEDAFLLLRREDRDDVGMAQAPQEAGLVQQLAEVQALLAVRDLDGDFLVEPRVLREVDRAKASTAERREDFVLADGLAAEEHTWSIAVAIEWTS